MAEKNTDKKEPNFLFERKFSFDSWDQKTISQCFAFAEGYKEFLSNNKTERKAVSWAEKQAEKLGYKKLEHTGEVKNSSFNSPLYSINRQSMIILARPGKKPAKEGLRMVLAHIDSPRLDLKVKPVYEQEHLAFLKTHYYGSLKKYQWTALPLAMYGKIVKQDGSSVDIEIGDNEKDPIFMITDLLPHLGKYQEEKKLNEAIPAETLNIVAGSFAAKGKEKEEGLAKKNLLNLLNEKYGIVEEDFVSADLELVPQGKARDIGFDRSLISGYGHDDKICAFTGVKALFETEKPECASLVVLVDKEEIGSEGNTSATSSFIIDFVSELLYLESGRHDENHLRDALSLSKAISADVTAGFDPDYAEVFDPNNTARIGAGVAVEKYNGAKGKSYTSEASAEYTAFIRKILNKNGINWQTGGLGKIDIGGGGTIAMFLAHHNIDVIDIGPALFSMHAPFEIASKADIYSAYQAYKAFFEAE